MPASVKELFVDALSLSAIERAALAAELLESLDRADPRIDALWANEAESRLAAFEAGEIRAIPAEDVFAELENL
jgi:putative addiction module component (TIGR02574 family)